MAQTTYYVASSGSDGNTGRSADAPFQTIAKVNSLSLQPGDQVLFRQGDTFRGDLQIRQSGSAGKPIVIDAYGSGNKPVLAGSSVVSNWTNIGNNTWQASCPSCGDRVTGVFRDNATLPLGRYPNLDAANKGYLTVQSHSGKSQLTSQQGLSTNWTGGEAVFRPVQWILNRSKITGQSGNTLNLDGSGSYDVSDNWGYFIQNHPATLDQVGEWYYNAANKTIQLYDNQSNPNNQTITATTFAEAVNLSGVSYVTVRNVQLTQSLATSLLISNSSNIVFSNNSITFSGEDGIVLLGTGSQVLMENNVIDNVNSNGVTLSPYQNVTFRGNTLRNVGLIPGRGKSGDGTYEGFLSKTTLNTLIENNVFDNIGYNAIDFSNSTIIQHNQISNFCVVKSDGSGLYTWNGNQLPMSDIHLLSNVIYNGIGASDGSPSGSYSGANGIYLDDCTTNIEVANNTVYNCKGWGIYLHGSSSIKLTGNTSYNNAETQLAITYAQNCQPRSNVITNNIFVSRTADQLVAKFESGQNDLSSFGQFDNNVYARPFDDNNKISYYNGGSGGTITLAQWQSQFGRDLTSTNSPFTYASGNPDDYIKFVANPTATASQVSLDGTYRDAHNNVVTGSVSVAAYSSVILFKDVAASVPLRTPENPANAVTGLDYSYYETYWTSLPDFSTLTPVKTGTINTPTLTVRNRDTSYGLRFSGYISVPTDGVYTFYTNSDDGSKLLIGTTEVVNNDGGHGDQERSGTIGLKAGVHAISIPYFQGGGGQSLIVSYSGPGIGKQTIPDAAFQRVSAGTTTPAPPTADLRTPENPANAVTGLDYSYYENFWTTLPDFSTLTPVKTGTINTPTLTVRNRDTSYGLKYTGYISVPTDGVYTFYTTSDDGSKLLIGTTEVVNNDGGHGDQERSGTIGLKAGVHAISIPYFQGGGGQTLIVSYSGPGIGKQTIPDAAFRRVSTGTTTPTPPTPPTADLRTPENPANAVAGIDYSYYENSWSNLPDFSTLTPVKTGTNNASTLSVRNRDSNFALKYTGYVSVPTDGVYTFYTTSDDGTKLLIGTTTVVSNDGVHGDQEMSGTIGLKAGVHAFSVLYFQGGGGLSLSVSYSGPGLGKQIIPDAAYRRVPAATTTPPANTAPTAVANANQTGTVGTSFVYTASAFNDAETPNSLVYAASFSPAGNLVFDKVSRGISGTPSASGVITVTITATDPGGLSANTTFTITVNPAAATPANTAPTGGTNANQTGTAGTSFLYIAAAFTDAETPNSLVYTAGFSPAGNLVFDKVSRGISGTPSTSGVIVVTITATDPGGLSTSTTFNITINPASAPVGGSGQLTVSHMDATYGQTGTNTIKPYLQINNPGTTAVPYNAIKVRYWLSVEGTSPITNFQTYYAQVGSNNVHVNYVPIVRQSTNAYVEYSFDAAAGSLAGGSNSGPINNGFVKQDYSSFNQADDYSYALNRDFTLNPHITAYINGALVYGTEPASGARIGADPESTGKMLVQVLGNPVQTGSLVVVVSGVTGEALRYELTDMSGHLLSEQRVEQANAVDRQTLSLENRPAGLFFLRVSTTTQSQTVKVIRH